MRIYLIFTTIRDRVITNRNSLDTLACFGCKTYNLRKLKQKSKNQYPFGNFMGNKTFCDIVGPR